MKITDDPVELPTNLGLSPQRYKIVRRVAGAAIQKFHEDNEWGAYEEVRALENDMEKLALWAILRPHPALRACLKRYAVEEWRAK